MGYEKRWEVKKMFKLHYVNNFFNKTVTTEHEVTRRYVEVLRKIEGEGVGVDMI